MALPELGCTALERGPLARAYHLLQKIDLGPERGSQRGPLLEFNIGFPPRRQHTLCQREGYVVSVAPAGAAHRPRHAD